MAAGADRGDLSRLVQPVEQDGQEGVLNAGNNEEKRKQKQQKEVQEVRGSHLPMTHLGLRQVPEAFVRHIESLSEGVE